jgi:rhodanese-related sulfurtransferase
MTIKRISPAEAFAMMSDGAILIDVREADEWRREHVAGARLHALSSLEREPPRTDGAAAIFHCRSGNRTAANAQRLAASVPGAKAYLLEGGLEAWRDAGLPVVRDASQPIEVMRQVQIAAGSLVAAGTALGAFIHPGFLAIPGFVGAGLVFAGASGFCGLARLLALAPWNRMAAAPVNGRA